MAEWVNLTIVVQELAGRTLLSRGEAGAHLQTALINGELKTRAHLLALGQADAAARPSLSSNGTDALPLIPADFWRNIEVNWRKTDEDDDEHPYVFKIEDDQKTYAFFTYEVEALRADAFRLIDKLSQASGAANEANLSPGAKNSFKNRGGAP